MVATFPPPYTSSAQLPRMLAAHGSAALAAEDLAALCDTTPVALDELAASWDDLPEDAYLRDGGRYRHRRHACYLVEDGRLLPGPRRAHYQPLDYNALHGGMQRWFEPITEAVQAHPAWQALLLGLSAQCSAVKPAARWHVEAHQFRIDTGEGIGRPTPEGAHRDGVDFVAVILVRRHAIIGGETRVFAADRPDGQRFTLCQPWSLLLMDDARMIHETTPIQPQGEDAGHRDTLVLTWRAAGFLGDAPD
ncbi:MAG: 2OG-Fe dioxygenase family protein [Pseudoxanthomonas suwonensis]|nr:2OG-Fe dioxygenase family protein [Pseudoxanthomonas suwonensis]